MQPAGGCTEEAGLKAVKMQGGGGNYRVEVEIINLAVESDTEVYGYVCYTIVNKTKQKQMSIVTDMVYPDSSPVHLTSLFSKKL